MSQKARKLEAEILKLGYDFHTRTKFDRTEEEYIVSKDGLHYVLLTEDMIFDTSVERLLQTVEHSMKILINKSKQ